MADNSDKLNSAVALLSHSQSQKRVSGAKQLRKLADPAAGKALLAALQHEVLDPRTWSAQYHIILALGFCQYRPALDFLWELSRREIESTTIYYGLGDAIVRIDHKSNHDFKPLFDTIASRRFELIDGAFRAMALLKMVPTQSEIAKIIKTAELAEAVPRVRGYPNDPRGLRTWVVVAAALWPAEAVHDFLVRCQNLGDLNLRIAAEHSLNRKYVKHMPY